MDATAGQQTLGEVIQALTAMGFEESRVREALSAGFVSLQDAVDWLIQGDSVRRQPGSSAQLSLKWPATSVSQGAMAAFNHPAELPGTSQSMDSAQLGSGSQELKVVSRKRNPEKENFGDKQREQEAIDAKAEKQRKIKEREMVLKRIEEDRKQQQEKPSLGSGPSTEGGGVLGGRRQTSVSGQCLLQIRLPSGELLRDRFPCASTLRNVQAYLSEHRPGLPLPVQLFQPYPRQDFGTAELELTLAELGLVPNGTLCVRRAEESSRADASPSCACPMPKEGGGVTQSTQGHFCASQDEEAVNNEAITTQGGSAVGVDTPVVTDVTVTRITVVKTTEDCSVGAIEGEGCSSAKQEQGRGAHTERSTEPMSHESGRDQAMDIEIGSGDVAEEAVQEAARGSDGQMELEEQPHPDLDEDGQLPQRFGFHHNWVLGFPPRARQHHDLFPGQGHRLQDEGADGDGPDRQPPHFEVALPPFPSVNFDPGLRPTRGRVIPPLGELALSTVCVLITDPSMQFTSSLAGLNPSVAEKIIAHLVKDERLRPRTLDLFRGCPLQCLRLDCYSLTTNELLHQLRLFPSLKSLSLLSSSLITDRSLECLTSLSRLHHLNLASCVMLSDKCLVYIKELRSLKQLVLDRTRVTDAGLLAYLEQAPPSLVQLSLNQTAVTEATVRELPRTVPQLHGLSVKNTAVVDVSCLRQLLSLHALSLDNTAVSEESLAALADHPTLAYLSLFGVRSVEGDQALRLLSGLRLSVLRLPCRLTVTDAGLEHITRLTLLTELNLTDYIHISDAGAQHIACLKGLKQLVLSNTRVTDCGLEKLRGLRLLEELSLDRTPVTSRGVAAYVVSLPHLQVLSLVETNVGNSVLKHGIRHCNRLTKLNLSRTRITDRGLRQLRLPVLAQLNLDHTGATFAGLSALLTSCPSIVSLRASGLRTISNNDASDVEEATVGP
ncbi:uncharacterized protein LOC116940909 isoform X2 [Petromyzon marinus]|uniref:Uncharacterized protein LOC116940909 isoform X2 n=1 Tax=Petromyzon marinus TaxID=7757 RepID=A0AAJ7SX95_PETMA|nr:uncharacterized protein LOC116940909 isoform X2 [Petromyzon marinus]